MKLKSLLCLLFFFNSVNINAEERLMFKNWKLGERLADECNHKTILKKGFLCVEEGSIANIRAVINREYINNRLTQILIYVKKPVINLPEIFYALEVKYGKPNEYSTPTVLVGGYKLPGLTALWIKNEDSISITMLGRNSETGLIRFNSKEKNKELNLESKNKVMNAIKDL